MSAAQLKVFSPLGVFSVTLKALQDIRLAGRAALTAGRAAILEVDARMVEAIPAADWWG